MMDKFELLVKIGLILIAQGMAQMSMASEKLKIV
jgi:hypothetical protein